MRIRVGHLYPDYLNIYADRGNIAVLSRRAAWRGHELEVHSVSVGDPLIPGEHDLLYVGGGQDREQALVAQDLVAKAAGVRESVAAGAGPLAGCGGGRSRIARAGRRSSSRWPTSSRPRPMRSRPSGRKPAAAVVAERRTPTLKGWGYVPPPSLRA